MPITIDQLLLQDTIVHDAMMQQIDHQFAPLSAFSTEVNAKLTQLDGTDKVLIPFIPRDLRGSKSRTTDGKFPLTGSNTIDHRAVTLQAPEHLDLAVQDTDMRDHPFTLQQEAAIMTADQLALNTMEGIYSAINTTNFTTTPINIGASADFDYDDFIRILNAADSAKMPTSGRSVVLRSDYANELIGDTRFSNQWSGNGNAINTGQLGSKIGGANFYKAETLPASDNIVGFICLPQALLVGFTDIPPAPGFTGTYSMIKSPASGVPMGIRSSTSIHGERMNTTLEVRYGYGVGQQDLLIPITSA